MRCEASRTVLDALKMLDAKGMTILFVSLYLSEVAELCDRVTVLRDGRVSADVRGDDVTEKRLVRQMTGVARPKPASRPRASRADPIVEGRHLAVPPLRQLNFKLCPNECLDFAGLLGSGRESAVNVISGAVRLWGSVSVRSEFMENPREAMQMGLGILSGSRSLAIVPGWNLIKHLSLPTLESWSRFGVIREKAEREPAVTALDRLKVAAEPDHELADLSGGDQQRALMSRWLMYGSQVLLINEPCVGVDIAARGDLIAALRDYAASKSVIAASSDPGDLVECCDRVLACAAASSSRSWWEWQFPRRRLSAQS